VARRLRRTHQLPQRDFGWNRTRNDTLNGTRTWCGHGIFNHNLIKIAALTTT
jgi:IS5 family transposase